MLKSLALGVIAMSALALSGAAQATSLTLSASFSGSPSAGSTVYTGGNGTVIGSPALADVFDDGTIAYFYVADVVSGSSVGQYAAPYDANAGAQQTSPYFVAYGGGQITFDFAQPTNAVGLLWGSVDSAGGQNVVSLYSGADGTGTLLGQFDGASVQAAVSGLNEASWGTDGSVYANIASSSRDIKSAVFSDANVNSFEFDKVSVSPVPLPGALPLFASAVVGLGVLARRRKTKLVG